MDRKCKVCHKKLQGRSDKKYCDAQCKNDYHKYIRFKTKKVAIEINGFLKRNYMILHEIIGENQPHIKVHRNELSKRRFRFKYHTHFYINSKNKMYFYVYDIAWMEFSDDEVMIVKR